MKGGIGPPLPAFEPKAKPTLLLVHPSDDKRLAFLDDPDHLVVDSWPRPHVDVLCVNYEGGLR